MPSSVSILTSSVLEDLAGLENLESTGDFLAASNPSLSSMALPGLIKPPASPSNDNDDTAGAIECRSRLGGLLNFYYREAG